MSTRNHPSLRINGERLWQRLMTMAQIGATPKGGVCRVALTKEDRKGRDLFIEWCHEANCTIAIDQMGNIFARRAGTHNDLPPVLAGSHLDSQPTGGKFDGAYGVLAALEVVETLNDHNIQTTFPVEIVSWTNEEGARFAPAMIGSGVFAGVFDLAYGWSREDGDGRSLGQSLQEIGYAGDTPMGNHTIKATFELHIEQGPILESEGKVVGIVTGVQGMRWYELIIEGKETHAGPTPMSHRRDPVQGMVPILGRIYELAAKYTPHGRATVGVIQAEPGVINTVPGRLKIQVDLRHPETAVLDSMHIALQQIVAEECATVRLNGQVNEIWYSPPIAFAPTCINSVRNAVETVDATAMEIVSGAGHDAVYLARVAPTSMIFIPCEDGLSHNELENATKADVVAGANVLLHAVLAQAA
ncbi:MAG: Zn-dependent hydrolase [Chloroflexi bacterium]|nr:Zn-dependent hydrolase [Chloroflexota bacterium]